MTVRGPGEQNPFTGREGRRGFGLIPNEPLERLASRYDNVRRRAAGRGTVQQTDEARAWTAWILAAAAIVLMSGAAYLVYGPGAAIVMLTVLIVALLVVRRLFQ